MSAYLIGLVGGFKSGKTQSAYMRALEDQKTLRLPIFLMVSTPQTENEIIAKIPWTRLSVIKTNWAWASKNSPRRIVKDENFETILDSAPPAIWIFDDVSTLLRNAEDKNSLIAFITNVRHLGNRVFLTTQRISGVVPPFLRDTVQALYVVGPYANRKEAYEIFGYYDGQEYEDFQDFQKALKNNAKYNLFAVRS